MYHIGLWLCLSHVPLTSPRFVAAQEVAASDRDHREHQGSGRGRDPAAGGRGGGAGRGAAGGAEHPPRLRDLHERPADVRSEGEGRAARRAVAAVSTDSGGTVPQGGGGGRDRVGLTGEW